MTLYYYDKSSLLFEYYFIFSHVLSDTNISRVELIRLIEKIANSSSIDSKFEHNECGSYFSTDNQLDDNDLRRIIHLSGYIQYAGRTIIRAPWNEVDDKKFINTINLFLEKYQDRDKYYPVLLANTVEGFPIVWPYKLSGVANSQFYREKFYFKNKPLLGIFQEIEKMLDITVIDSIQKLERIKKADGKEIVCLYMIKDDRMQLYDKTSRNNNDIEEYPGMHDITYMVLMESRYSSKNMIHLFDDDKPYWPDRITTPPRLVAAGLNLTKIPLDACDDSINKACTYNYHVFDPFVGSGTTVLEALKYPVKITVNDIDGGYGVKDNTDFFARFSSSEINEFMNLIEKKIVDEKDPFLFSLMKILTRWFGGGPEINTSITLKELMQKFENKGDVGPLHYYSEDRVDRKPEALDHRRSLKDFLQNYPMDNFLNRSLIYQVYRVLSQKYSDCIFFDYYIDHALFRKAYQATWSRKISNENAAKDYYESKLSVYRDQLAELERNPDGREVGYLTNHYNSRQTLRYGIPYKMYCNVNIDKVNMTTFDINQMANLDSSSLSRVFTEKEKTDHDQHVDLIITDVPYSLNERIDNLILLYKNFLDLSCRLLKDGGDLVIFSLDKVRSGKEVPDIALRSNFENMVVNHFQERGRSIREAELPLSVQSFSKKLYWKSKKALNRVVLHYQVD